MTTESKPDRIPGHKRSPGFAAKKMMEFLLAGSDNPARINAILDTAVEQGFDREQMRDALATAIGEGRLDGE